MVTPLSLNCSFSHRLHKRKGRLVEVLKPCKVLEVCVMNTELEHAI